MIRQELALLLVVSLFTTILITTVIASDQENQTEKDAYQRNYRELEGLPYPMLIAELDLQIEWILIVSAAAPPDLRHKIEVVKHSVFEALKKKLCARDGSKVLSQLDKRDAATRSLVAALAPKSVEAHEKGEIAATLVRIIEYEPDRLCRRP